MSLSLNLSIILLYADLRPLATCRDHLAPQNEATKRWASQR